MIIKTESLPSRGIPYQYKEIEMEGFKVPQIMKLSKASSLKSIKPAIDALDDVLSVVASELTDGDFFYLLTLQRLAYSKPLFTEWHCDEILYYDEGDDTTFLTKQQIKDKVEEYEATEDKEGLTDPNEIKLVPGKCMTFNKHILTVHDLTITYLEEEPLNEGIDYPRIETLTDAIKDGEDPEMHYLAQAIRWLRTETRSYLAKKDLLLGLPDTTLLEQAMAYNNKVIHGVNKRVVCPCSKCGHKTAHILDIGPESFFDV